MKNRPMNIDFMTKFMWRRSNIVEIKIKKTSTNIIWRKATSFLPIIRKIEIARDIKISKLILSRKVIIILIV